MWLEIYIFILFVILLVFMYRFYQGIINRVGKRRYYKVKAFITVKEETEEGLEASTLELTKIIDFPIPPAIGQEVSADSTIYIVENVLIDTKKQANHRREREVRVGFRDLVESEESAPASIERLQRCDWKHIYDGSQHSDPAFFKRVVA